MKSLSLIPFNFRQDLEPLNWLRPEVNELFNDAWKMPTTESRLGNFSLSVGTVKLFEAAATKDHAL